MNVTFITLSSSLRSTTCVIDATIRQLRPKGLNPTIVYKEQGPWAEQMKNEGIECYFRDFITPDKSKPFEFLSNLKFWLKLFKKQQTNIIHINEHDYYPMIKHAARIAKIPVVVGVRFVLEGGYAKWAFGQPYNPAKLLFTSGDQLKRSRSEIPEEIPDSNIEIFGNGRDLDKLISYPDQRSSVRKMWNAEPQHIVFGTASAIRPRKRIEDFIRLIGHLIAQGYPVKGVVGGGGKYADQDYFNEMEQLIIELNLTDQVKMLGNLEEMAPFYQGIDVFVSTSELETFGMSVCEAMAFAKPVIAYEGGSVQEVLADDRYIAENKSLEQLIQLAEGLMQNTSNFASLGAKHKQRVFDNFNAPALAQKLALTYKSIDPRFDLSDSE